MKPRLNVFAVAPEAMEAMLEPDRDRFPQHASGKKAGGSVTPIFRSGVRKRH